MTYSLLKIINKDFKRILVIQGGGIKGIIPIIQLRRLQNKLGIPLCKYFDLIVGTSTGAIIASMLSFGISAEIIKQIYIKEGSILFTKNNWFSRTFGSNALYNRQPIIKKIISIYKNHFSMVPYMGQSKTNFAVATFGCTSRRTHLIKSYDQRHTGLQMVSESAPFGPIRWSALSAPYYFGQISVPYYKWLQDFQVSSPTWQYGQVFQDGGVGLYNSCMRKAYEQRISLGWTNQKIDMLVLGCGEQILRKNINQVRDDWNITQGVKYLGMARLQSLYDQIYGLTKIMHGNPNFTFNRISPLLTESQDKLDAIDHTNQFIQIGDEMISKMPRRFLQNR